MDELPLDGVLVVELGSRIAVGAAGGLLAQLGAHVLLVEPPAPRTDHKWAQRDLFAAGKLSRIAVGREAAALAQAADLVLVSSDLDGTAPDSPAIVCDITACGTTGPLAGRPLGDTDLQALCGIADTTGAADGPPLAIGVPFLEMSAALYAAAALLAAWRVRRAGGPRQDIEVALYDVAVNALTTFLPNHFGGRTPTRVGNWHNLIGPWNSYRAADGWVLICTASEPQWRRLCSVIGRPQLVEDARFATLAGRVAGRPALDEAIGAWTRGRTVEACVAAVGAANIPCGPITRLAALADEPNLAHRAMVRSLTGSDGATCLVPGSPFRADSWRGRAPEAIPARDGDRAAIDRLLAARPPGAPSSARASLPLAGLRVVEIGQYTTAPLAARYLLGFGAEVIRVEPPGGEASRAWVPGQDGMSYFFAMFNGSKRALELDLAGASGRAALADLLRDADMLVDNLKPGALARLGFDPAKLAALNPRLIHCAISGFGIDSAYPERPAFDSVVQAMSGLMDATRGDGVPYKAGISIADIGGGQFALVALLAGLLLRDRTGAGQAIDLSMQDGAAWLAQTAWRGAPEATALARACTVGDVADHPQTAARGLLYRQADRRGLTWWMLGPPVRLSATPLVAPDPAEPLPRA